MKNFIELPILLWILSAVLLICSIFVSNILLKIGLSITSGIIMGNLLWEREQRRKNK